MMDEFTKEYFNDQTLLLETTITKINLNKDKFSTNAISNLCVVMKEFQKLVANLVHDIETGKIGKTPKRLKSWKKKKMKQQAVDEKDAQMLKQELELMQQTQPYPEEAII